MTILEGALIGIVCAILGCAGGLWMGAKGKVAISFCSLKHQELEQRQSMRYETLETLLKERLQAIEKKLDAVCEKVDIVV